MTGQQATQLATQTAAKRSARSQRPSLGAVRRGFAPWENPSAKPFIEFRNVTKRFGKAVAVDDLSLKIYEREFFCLLGPSGCGKTTLMRMLAGFESPTSGEVWLDGQNLSAVPPHRRPVNMMFQSYALFPHMSVANNVAFGLRQAGPGERMSKHAIAQRVDEMLALVKLQDFGARKPHQLSGGQRQRAALARALAPQPKVLLLDEPLGALDKKLREETQYELADLQESLGLTFIVVTHDQEEAMTMADRIAVMRSGAVDQIATPAELYEEPGSRSVAEFVGSINILEGTVSSISQGSVTLDGPNGQLIVNHPDHKPQPQVGATAWVAVRPEKLDIVRLGEDGPAPAANCIEGEVWDIGYLGDMTLYNVRTKSGTNARASILNRSRTVHNPLTWEETVRLTFPPAAGTLLLS
ncbi:MAG: ABC transporter ATP-binding protein [Pseudomonadota bacterium]